VLLQGRFLSDAQQEDQQLKRQLIFVSPWGGSERGAFSGRARLSVFFEDWREIVAEKKTLDLGIGSRVYNPFPYDEVRNEGSWRIGSLAQACGVSTDTLRHYERKGVLSAGRSANGYRSYPARALARVKLVRRALAVGFTLDELGTVLKVRDRGGAPCRRVRELAAEKLSAVESQLSDLSVLRDELRSSLKDWDARLAQTDPAAPAGLLEALASSKNNQINKPLRSVFGKRSLTRTGVKS
jgi:DNA-binding transcriptional MerR regulator